MGSEGNGGRSSTGGRRGCNAGRAAKGNGHECEKKSQGFQRMILQVGRLGNDPPRVRAQ